MKKKKIIISGYYGFDNSGDDAILKAIVNSLRQTNEDIDITVLSNSPASTEKIYKVKAVNRLSIIQVIKTIFNTDMLISGGGSLLQDITSTRSILYYLAIMYIARIFKKPIMVYANGIGPINKKINRMLTKHILNKVDLITLRDYSSKKTLHEIGVKNKMYITSDPVFTLKASEQKKVTDIFQKENIPTDKKLVGISVRQWEKSKDFIKIISEVIPYIVDKYDVNIVIIPMHYPEDLKISNEICELANTKNCYVIKENYSVEDIMGIINTLDLILAMRLHSLIYAATQAIPMIGLVYDPKVSGFLDSIDQNTDLNTESLEFNEICEHVDRVWNERENIKQELIVKRNKLKEQAMENISLSLDILKRS